MFKVKIKSSLLSLLLTLVVLTTTNNVSAEILEKNSSNQNNVPEKFQQLYKELDEQLSTAENKVGLIKITNKNKPLMAPSLFIYFSSAEKGSEEWNYLIKVLDGYQMLGVKSVSFMISFPALTCDFTDIEPSIKFYESIASEIRKRNMKMVIEHFVYPSIVPTKAGKFVSNIKTLENPKKAFLDWSKEEIKLIVSKVKPDYLSLISEPETYNKFLGFKISPEEYSQWTKEVIKEVYSIKGNTKIGVGAGIWEEDNFIKLFSSIKEVDYIDIHFYAMKLKSEDMFDKLLKVIDQIKSTDSSKDIIMSETWLYKHGAEEPKGVFNVEAYGRNVYDFWEPLDNRYLKLINELGIKKGISLIAPYFPQYFFYNQKYDPSISISWPMSMIDEWKKAVIEIDNKKIVQTGNDFKNLLKENN